MNAQAIRRLRRKFIFISTVTYFLVMVFMGSLINLSNFIVVRRQIRQVLDYMLEEDIAADDAEAASGSASGDGTSDGTVSAGDTDTENRRRRGETALDAFSPEFHYTARYFTALYSENGTREQLHTAHIVTLTDAEAAEIADAAYRRGRTYGRAGTFYYKLGADDEGQTHLIFLNCASQINSYMRLMYLTMEIAAAGLVIALILVYLFSYRVIQPEIENVRRQKQFITNASHELKTPLAVIRANTEIEEMMNGESEWTQSTMRQVDRLSGLIQNLVMIARAQEKEDRSVMAAIDVTKGVEETVKPYESLAQQEKKELVLDLAPDVSMVADESKIRQLASLLIDNAFKYCDDGGRVCVTLDSQKKGKVVRLAFSNSYADGANVDYSRFFERFYREDEAHNVDKGGYGIGLSIAESICQQYGGSIEASWKDGEITFTCLLS